MLEDNQKNESIPEETVSQETMPQEEISPSDSSGGPGDSGDKKKRRKLFILLAVAALLVVGAIVLAVNLDLIINRPEDLFTDSLAQPTHVTGTRLPEAVSETSQPSRTLSPEEDSTKLLEELEAAADYTFVDAPQVKDNIINLLLIGIDYAPERDNNPKEYVGKNFNSDVMMVIAINLDDHSASMISVPRDSYAYIPDAKAPYKLNFSLTFGGGISEPGFMKVCDSVEAMLGGIPVDYYMAVTMTTVKELGDAVGGVDFNIDVPFKIQGRSYDVGPQHLDGQGILDYCRARKNMNESGDLNRVDRQKEMLFTVFKKLQRSEMILKVPSIVSSMKGKVFTNLSFNQFAALSLIGLDVDPNDIDKYTFSGTHTDIFNYGYVLTDQKKRVQIIKDVYDVDVPVMLEYSPEYAHLKWSYMLGTHYVSLVKPQMKKEAALAEAEKRLTPEESAELETLLTDMEKQLKNAEKLLKKSGTISLNEYTHSFIGTYDTPYKELDANVTRLRELATTAFSGTPYEIKNWHLDLYKEDGVMRMKE